MADLDDFFAKKDKRSKNKKKTKPIETLEKKLEDVNRTNQERARKVGEVSVHSVAHLRHANLNAFLIQDDDEWNNFEEEKDYSGLKIQALSIEEEAQREAQEEAKKAAEQAAEVVWTEKAEGAKPTAAPKPTVDDDVPEFMRAFQRRKEVKIDDVIEFPSLGTPAEAYDEIKGFQTVRTGQSSLNPNQAARDNIKTANKFSALRD